MTINLQFAPSPCTFGTALVGGSSLTIAVNVRVTSTSPLPATVRIRCSITAGSANFTVGNSSDFSASGGGSSAQSGLFSVSSASPKNLTLNVVFAAAAGDSPGVRNGTLLGEPLNSAGTVLASSNTLALQGTVALSGGRLAHAGASASDERSIG